MDRTTHSCDITQFLSQIYTSLCTHRNNAAAARVVMEGYVSKHVCVERLCEMRARKFCICVMFRDIQVTEAIRDGRGQEWGETQDLLERDGGPAMIMMLLLS